MQCIFDSQIVGVADLSDPRADEGIRPYGSHKLVILRVSEESPRHSTVNHNHAVLYTVYEYYIGFYFAFLQTQCYHIVIIFTKIYCK